jgi:hypothetical protein
MVIPRHSPWAAALLAAAALGAAMVAVAIGWWAIVFYGVNQAAGVPMADSVSCMFETSATCSLAMSLCRSDHFLGITRYSAGLLWAGVGVASAAALARSFLRTA